MPACTLQVHGRIGLYRCSSGGQGACRLGWEEHLEGAARVFTPELARRIEDDDDDDKKVGTDGSDRPKGGYTPPPPLMLTWSASCSPSLSLLCRDGRPPPLHRLVAVAGPPSRGGCGEGRAVAGRGRGAAVPGVRVCGAAAGSALR